MERQLEKLTQLGTEAVQAAITEYTHWFLISSLCWLAFGVVCAIAAVKVWRKREDWEFANMAALILVIIAVLTVPFNVPTLVQPRACAIHQLIKDSR